MHKQNFIHRDLKPSNIIIDGDLRPHIIDLGEVGDADSDVTRVHGTIQFESKHSFLGEKKKSVDVYAFAVTLFKIITGHLPFDSYYPLNGDKPRKPEGEKGEKVLEAYETYKNAEKSLEKAKEEGNDDVQEKEDDLLEKKEILDGEFDIFIKDSVCSGHHDDTYKESSEEFKKLSPRKQEIMKLVNLIINSDGDYLSLEGVEKRLKEIMKKEPFESNLYNDVMNRLEEIDELDDEWFGTFKYLEKAKKCGFDCYDESIRICLSFDGSYVYEKRSDSAARSKFRKALKTKTARSLSIQK